MQSRNKLVYYHQHFRRVPTIDECEIDDQLCFFEAERQFARDRFDLRVKLNRHRYSFAFLQVILLLGQQLAALLQCKIPPPSVATTHLCLWMDL